MAGAVSCGGDKGSVDKGPPPAATNGPPTSGTRLKAVLHESAGAVPRWTSLWQDTQLDIRCSFRAIAADKLWCEPVGALPPATTVAMYADEACTKRVFSVLSSSNGYLRLPGVSTCPTYQPIYRQGPQWTAGVFVSSASKGCVSYVPANPVYEVTDIGEQLARAAIKPGVDQGGIAALMFEGADGSAGFWSWKDVRSGLECEFPRGYDGQPWPASDGVFRCVPKTTTATAFFADTACTQLTVAVSPALCQDTYAIRYQQEKCPTTIGVYPVGEPTGSREDYENTTGVCRKAGGIISTAEFRFLKPEVAPSDMVAATVIAPRGGARLQVQDLAFPGAIHRRGYWWDADLKTPCQRAQASDGKFRCFPSYTLGASPMLYADADCTGPVAYSTLTSHCDDRFARQESFMNGNPFHLGPLYKVGSLYKDMVYSRTSGTCQPAKRADSWTYYRLGSKIPDEDLVEVDEVIR